MLFAGPNCGVCCKRQLVSTTVPGSVLLSWELSYLPIPWGRGREWGGEGQALCPRTVYSVPDFALRVLEPRRGQRG